MTTASGVKHAAGRVVRSALRPLGYDVVRRDRPARRRKPPPDLDATTLRILDAVDGATLTTPERVSVLVDSVRHLVRHDVPGAMLECGVWRGGSMMAVALTLVDLGVDDRELYLFDTFTHMPEPGAEDRALTGQHASEILDEAGDAEAFRYITLDEVKDNLRGTGYPEERMHFVQGMVEETLPGAAPETVALCRLDTDWYASTRHEMQHLWPRLSGGGILLVDDYGHFLGCRQAVDEYVDEHDLEVFLHRIDYSGRLVLKPRSS